VASRTRHTLRRAEFGFLGSRCTRACRRRAAGARRPGRASVSLRLRLPALTDQLLDGRHAVPRSTHRPWGGSSSYIRKSAPRPVTGPIRRPALTPSGACDPTRVEAGPPPHMEGLRGTESRRPSIGAASHSPQSRAGDAPASPACPAGPRWAAPDAFPATPRSPRRSRPRRWSGPPPRPPRPVPRRPCSPRAGRATPPGCRAGAPPRNGVPGRRTG